jgi:hypothetical protein
LLVLFTSLSAARYCILFYPTWIFLHSIVSNMSLQALSTEVDTLIFGYLDRADRSRLMRVSKAYYETGKPFLYSEIRLRNDQGHRVKLLLLTLLQRPKLVECIVHFHLEPGKDTTSGDNYEPGAYKTYPDGDLCDRLMSHAAMVKDAIYKIPFGDTSFRLKLFSRVWTSYPCFDGALALILCLAVRMKDLSLAAPKEDDLRTTQEVIRHSSTPASAMTTSPLFANMESLRIIGPLAVVDSNRRSYGGDRNFAPITIGLKELVLEDNWCSDFKTPQSLLSFKSPFTRLVLDKVEIGCRALEGLFREPWAKTLEVLHVTGSYKRNGLEHDFYTSGLGITDFQKLNETMVAHLPALKEFVWIKAGSWARVVSFTLFESFKAIEHLEILRIDYDLFVRRESNPPNFVYARDYLQTLPGLAMVKEFLPPQLKVLELHRIEFRTMTAFYESITTGSDQPSALDVLRNMRKSLPRLEKVVIVIDMRFFILWTAQDMTPELYEECEKPQVHYLRSLADMMLDLGVQLEVRYLTDKARVSTALLVKPGYTAETIYFEPNED